MARRRRNRWRRVSPDRGWLTGFRSNGFNNGEEGENASLGFSQFMPLIDFTEVDNDDDGTLITHDKSNWFCVRMLLDLVFTTSQGGTPSTNSTQAQEVQCLLGVGQNPSWLIHSDPSAPEWAGAPFEYGWYAALNRILYTDYGICQSYSVGQGINANNRVQVDSSAATRLLDPAMATRLHMKWDLSTRFSLFPESSVGLLYGGHFDSSEHLVGWPGFSVIYCSATYRTLWQRGRGR